VGFFKGFLTSLGAMGCNVPCFEVSSTFECNLLVVKRIGLSVVFDYELYFHKKSFVKIHVDANACKGGDEPLLSFGKSKMRNCLVCFILP
jgi:hypothetical protein